MNALNCRLKLSIKNKLACAFICIHYYLNSLSKNRFKIQENGLITKQIRKSFLQFFFIKSI